MKLARNVKPRENNHSNQLNHLNQSFRWGGSSRQNRPIGLGCNQDGVRQGGLGRGPTLKAKLEVRDGLNKMLIVRFFLIPLKMVQFADGFDASPVRSHDPCPTCMPDPPMAKPAFESVESFSVGGVLTGRIDQSG